jgi:hypothetical protein
MQPPHHGRSAPDRPQIASTTVTEIPSGVAVTESTALTVSPRSRFVPQPTRGIHDWGRGSINQFTLIGIRRLGTIDPDVR